MADLKPCPLCGKPVNIYCSSVTKNYYAVHLDEQNSDCFVLMPLGINHHRILLSLADAYAVWNRMASDA